MQGYEFQVEGSYTIRTFGQSNPYDTEADASEVVGSFSMMVSNCHWKVRYWQSDLTADYTEVGTDGLRIYTVRSVVNQSLTNALGEPSKGVNKELGTVDLGPYPNNYNTPIACVLWWAYSSACYLRTNQENLYYPIEYSDLLHSVGLYQSKTRFPGTIERHAVAPNVPVKMIVMDDGYERSWPRPESQTFLDLMTKTRRPYPFDRGFTNNVIVTGNFYSLGDLEIPKTVSASFFIPINKVKTNNNVDLVRTYSVKATNISSTLTLGEFVPRVSHKIYVADNRFVESVPPVHDLGYLTEKRWLTDEEVISTPEYQNRIRLLPVDRKGEIVGAARDRQRRDSPAIVFTFVIIGMGLPIMLWLLLKNRRSQGKAT